MKVMGRVVTDMRLRRVLVSVGATVAATAAANRLLTRKAGPLGPPLERETGTYRWRGMDISFTEAGDPEDPDLLLLHGIHPGASSREFNRIIERLATNYHVLAPDLPGFGRSDRPPVTYTAALYASFIEELSAEMTDQPTVIASGLTSAYVLDVAGSIDLDRLVLICPYGTTQRDGSRQADRLVRLPVIGPALTNALTSRMGLRATVTDKLVYDPAALSEHDIEFLWQATHQPGARFPIASLFGGRLDVNVDLGAKLAALDVETTVVWGRELHWPPLEAGRVLAETGNVKLVVIDRARLLPHLEQAGPFLEVLEDELTLSLE